MDDNNNIKKAPNIPPFLRYCSAIIPTAFDDSLSYYEALCALYKYLQDNIVNVINNNATVTQYYIDLVKELKSYVENYFANLDVQEEINNKLDEMAEDGTLINTIYNYLPSDVLSFKNLSRVQFSETDLYEGYDHCSLQGFCIAPNGNVIAAIRSYQENDNYVKLCEINYKTGTVVRYAYLELQHANSLSYRTDNNTIYVAACNTVSGGEVVEDNRIFVVSYSDFTITQTITPTDLPEGHRIRSVWYDNETSTLYAGDIHDMFKLDSNNAIVETIELETTYIDTNSTNQTLKKIGDFYYGLYVSFLAIWDSSKKLVKVINIDLYQQGSFVGEVEDFAFDSDGNIILGSVSRPSPRLQYRLANFFISNLTKGMSEPETFLGADTTACQVYVNSASTQTKEDGSQTYPFKDLQIAINYANQLPRYAKIFISEGSYNYTYITGFNHLEIQCAGDITIDGLEIVASNVRFLNSEYDVIINGVSEVNADIIFQAQNSLTINKNTKSGTTGYNRCIVCYNGNAVFKGASLVGDDSNNLTYIADNAIVSFDSCEFTNYENHYAIRGNNNAVIYTFDNVYNETISDTQHNISVENGAKLYHRNGMYSKQNFNVESQGMVYPTAVQVSLDSPVYYGALTTVDEHFNHIGFTVAFAENSNATNEQVFETGNLNNATINTCYIGNNGLRVAHLKLSYNSETKALSIAENKNFYIANDGTCTSSSTNATPAAGDKYKFACIKKITYMNL